MALLPKEHSVSRIAEVPMPPDALFALIYDVDRYQAWRPKVKAFQRLADKNALPAWIEESGGMKIPMRFERVDRPSLLVARIDTDTLPFGGAWTYRIEPAPAGSRLTITEDGEVTNLFFRVMSRFVFGHYATMDAFLKDVQARARR